MLGEVCDVVRGSSPRPKSDPRFYGGTVPRLMVADLTRDGKVVSARIDTLTELGAKQSRPMKRGDVVIAVSGAPGLPAILAHDACIHDGFVGLRDLDGNRLDTAFLYAYLTFVRATSNSHAVGAIFKNLTTDQIKGIEIPELPLAEQRRIAEVLDRAEALRAKRRAALIQLDSLTQSLFFDLFGDPATNVKGWPRYHLEELCSIDSPLVDPTRDEYRNLLHYGPDRIERDTGGLLPAKTAEEDGLISAKFLFDDHAILYSKIRPNLNKVALAESRGLCSADVYPVEVKRDLLTQEFLWCLLRGSHFLSYTAEFSNRANIPKINRDQFLGYPAICPPIASQREFACRVGAVEKLKTSQRASLAELDALFASLQHRAFRGEL